MTRGQMAVFVVRARFGSTFDFGFPAIPTFGDVSAAHPFYQWIQKLAETAITSGCGGGAYCPDDPVTRGQMALFVMRGAFNELLPVGAPVLLSVSPSIRAPGEAVTVTVEGANTGFAVGVSEVLSGEGISVGAVFVVDADTLTVDLMIAPEAVDGPRSVIVKTGVEEAVLPNRFEVVSP